MKRKRMLGLLLTLGMILGLNMVASAVTTTTIGGKTEWLIGDSIDFEGTTIYYYSEANINNRIQAYSTNDKDYIKNHSWNSEYKYHIFWISESPDPERGGYSLYIRPEDYEDAAPKTPIGIKLVSGNGTKSSPYLFECLYEKSSAHTHNYATSWSSDENNHWHACTSTSGTCDAPKKDETAHTYGTSGDARFTCTVCGYVNSIKKSEAEAADQKEDKEEEMKSAAVVSKAPAALSLTYNGSAQALVSAGEASGGTMQYVLGSDAITVPTSGWDTPIPTGTKAGTYYVWYKAKGDASHTDSSENFLKVVIQEKSEEKNPEEQKNQQPENQKPASKPSGKPAAVTYQPSSESSPASEPTPAQTSAPTTQDAFTKVNETIDILDGGRAVVSSVSSTGDGSNTLTVTGMVNSNGTNYAVVRFAANSFSGINCNKIVIDLKTSGNTEKVEIMPDAFRGGGSRTLWLKLTSAGQVKFYSGALAGSNINKIVVQGLSKAEFRKACNKLKASGFKGKIVRKK